MLLDTQAVKTILLEIPSLGKQVRLQAFQKCGNFSLFYFWFCLLNQVYTDIFSLSVSFYFTFPFLCFGATTYLHFIPESNLLF